MNTESQKLAIQRHLSKPGRSLTPIDARRLFRCDRLGARIYELKQEGWPVRSELIPVGLGKRVARYHFERKRARK
jgi:hypothetical protein